jgi:hypothetical protein
MNRSRRATAIRCASLLLRFIGAPCLLVPASHAQNLPFVARLVGSNEQLCCWLRRIAAAMQHYRGASR